MKELIILFCIIAILSYTVESGIPFPKFGLGNKAQRDGKTRRTSNENDHHEMNEYIDEYICNDEFYAPLTLNDNDKTNNNNINYGQKSSSSRNNINNVNSNNHNYMNDNPMSNNNKDINNEKRTSHQIYNAEEILANDNESPDSMSSVSQFEPLQVMCEVNGYLVPAIIDTGAQITIMSSACAKRCRVSSNIDTRYAGRAIGIGSSDIIGRINGLDMRIGPVNFKNEVSILREARVDFLIGMDFLKRFKCDVSFNDHCLRLRVKDKRFKVPLVSENIDRPLVSASFAGIEARNDEGNDDVVEMNAVNAGMGDYRRAASSKSSSDASFISSKNNNNNSDVFDYESEEDNLGEPCSMEGV